jgi:hypothetical protein
LADMYKVMLSSTYDELKDHRQAVREAMLSQQMFPVAMEDDAALPDQDLIDASLAKVDESDGYVGLISYRYGQIPVCPVRNPQCLSLTELEFRRALERKIPICMFIMHDDHPVPKRELQKAQVDREKYESFLQLAKKDRIYAEFKSVQDLKAKTIQSLVKLGAALDKRAEASLPTSRDAIDLSHGSSGERLAYSGAERRGRFSESDFAKTIGHPVMVALGAALAWLTAGASGTIGPALTALLSAVGGTSFLAFSLMYRRYLGILAAGGDPKGSPERESYDTLRASLARGGLAARLYARRLSRLRDSVDDFFGDAGMADFSLLPRAFGLNEPAPLWTPRAFDRCLFLSFVYPVATIFLIWTVSGHAGPAELALGLKPDIPGLSRGLIAISAGLAGFAGWRLLHGGASSSAIKTSSRFAFGSDSSARTDALVALCAFAAAAAVTVAFGSSGAGAAAFGFALVASVASSGRVAGAISVAIAVPIALSLAFGLAGAPRATVAYAAVVTFIASTALLLLCGLAIKHRAQGKFLIFFTPAMIVACLALVAVLLPLRTWSYSGPLLLFQGLLTLITTPFNWASIGLTRALLRRGLELGGWWPYILALVNAVLASIIVVLMALAIVVAIQAFGELITRAGGVPFLPIGALFDGIIRNPAAPEYWWVYALLLATMSPSLINLMIGGASLIAGAPGLPTLLLRFMPDGNAVPVFDRTWLAVALTLQTFLGAILGVAAEAVLAFGMVAYIMPGASLDLFELAHAAADFNVPQRVFQLIGGGP